MRNSISLKFVQNQAFLSYHLCLLLLIYLCSGFKEKDSSFCFKFCL